MNSPEEIKKVVKNKYAEIAVQADQGGCCGPSSGTSCCDSSANSDYTVFNDSYKELNGYLKDADLGLGCGLPTEFADIREGNTVVDLGSGAGNDVFVARSLVGEQGHVIGIDMTEEMISKANSNLLKLGYKNIEFKLSEIENILLNNDTADVVISNCVLNLVPDKKKAFEEIYRILKPGAHFCVSDIVLIGDLPDGLVKAAEMYAGCVSGALQQNEYISAIEKTGFKNIEIKKSKSIYLSDDILKNYLPEDEIKTFRDSTTGIFSITVVGEK